MKRAEAVLVFGVGEMFGKDGVNELLQNFNCWAE